MYLFKDIFHGYGLLQAAPFHRSDAAICEDSQRRRRVLLGLRRTQGGQLHRENHQARLPQGEREGALARKDNDLVVRVDGKVVFQKKANGGMNEENAQQMIRQLETQARA